MVLVGVAAAVLAVCMVASYLTQGSMANLPFLKGQGGGAESRTGGSTALADGGGTGSARGVG